MKRREKRAGFVAVHPPGSELNAFRKAMKTAADSFHSGNTPSWELREPVSCYQGWNELPGVERVAGAPVTFAICR